MASATATRLATRPSYGRRVAVVQALTSGERPIPVWRVELHDGGWCRLLHHGGIVLDRASLEQVAEHLDAAGVDIERDLAPS